eukprot:scaffold81832_cov20-Prasinocladus_malaysianus.AAC.1
METGHIQGPTSTHLKAIWTSLDDDPQHNDEYDEQKVRAVWISSGQTDGDSAITSCNHLHSRTHQQVSISLVPNTASHQLRWQDMIANAM